MWIVYVALFVGVAGVVIASIRIGKNISSPKREPVKKAINADMFFGKKKHTDQTVAFYGEAKDLAVNFHSDQQILCDKLELFRFIDQLWQQTSQNFFALENDGKQILEISNNGKSDDYDLAYLVPNSDVRYIGNIKGTKLLKSVIDSYFNQDDLIELFHLIEE